MRARPVSVVCLVPTKKECVSGRILRITDASENVEIFRRPSPSFLVYIQSPIAGLLSQFQFAILLLPWHPQTYRFLASVKKTGGCFQSASLTMERTHGVPQDYPTLSGDRMLFSG